MIRTDYSAPSSGRGTTRSRPAETATRGAFFTPEDVVVKQKVEHPPLARVSEDKLKSELGLSGRQARDLAAFANVDFQEPYRAGRLDSDDGEVFLVTRQNSNLDPSGFKSLDSAFRIYAMEGNEIRQLPLTDASQTRSGGLTLHTQLGEFRFDKSNPATVLGYSLSKELGQSQLT
jgi:hypothetical protein